jgi:hypothetical protein
MPATEPEVFDTLLSSQKPQEVVLLAYGLFGQKKVEWERYIQQQSGQRPTRPQVDSWISNLPHGTYNGYLTQAEQLLSRRSNPITEMHRVGEEIIAKVADANSFLKQLRLAVATSILSPIIIGGLIAIAVSYHAFAPYWDQFENKIHNMFAANAEQAPTK